MRDHPPRHRRRVTQRRRRNYFEIAVGVLAFVGTSVLVSS